MHRPGIPVRPLSDAELERLESLLRSLPPPCEPLDVSALDGFLVGVLLQPAPVAPERWLAHVHDADARRAPAGVPLEELRALVLRRHAQLRDAIARRQWFDPWVFELDADPSGAAASPSASLLPWVAGLALAFDLFPAALALAGDAAREPLALLYMHFDPDDLDEDDLRELIDSLEPPATLDEAVELLVRATLLLADALQGQRTTQRAPRARLRRR